MKSSQIKYTLLLSLGALIWGCAFVFQSLASDSISPLFFNAARSFLAFFTILPLVIRQWPQIREHNLSRLLIDGSLTGFFLFLGAYFQQSGIAGTTTAKAGFLTALYIVMVPIVHLLLGKKASKKLWLSVLLALIGLYLLCNISFVNFRLNRSDLLLLGCALSFTIQIICVDYYSNIYNAMALSAVEFLSSAIFSLIASLLFENPQLSALKDAWLAIAYTGILSSGFGYTIQIVTQKYLDPTVASLCMSLESVFGALAGWLFLHQHLSGRELWGCLLMFAAIIIAQLPDKTEQKSLSQ